MSPRPSINPKDRKGYNSKKITAFSINIQKRRQELGMTQMELAAAVGVPNSRISAYEAGVVPASPDKLIAIADALNVSVDWLLGRKWPK